jgi:hypothetical protein
MTRSSSTKKRPAALVALERAAKKAVEMARRGGTPAYVLKDGKIVDIARAPRGKRAKRT